MRIPRIYIDDPLQGTGELRLDARAHHHLVHVLRLRPGTPIRVFNGRGVERSAVLRQADRRGASITPGERIHPDTESCLYTSLQQAVLRGDRMDFALQKSVELGINCIQPVWTERSERPLSGTRLERRMKHWTGVVISACEQSGRASLPEILPPAPICDTLGDEFGGAAFVLDPSAEPGLPGNRMQVKRVTVACGPESGLTRGEIETYWSAGFESARLGPRTLRAETAGVAALAIVQSLWGDIESGRGSASRHDT